MLGITISSLILISFSFFNLLGIDRPLFTNQLFFCLVGIVAFIAVRFLGKRFFASNAALFYISFLVLLVVTYVIGFEAKGSKRWIDLYIFNFQPSEFFKIFFILYLSVLLAKKSNKFSEFGMFIISLLVFAVPTLIIFLQPDLGNAMVYFVIYLSVVLFSYIPKKYILSFILILALAMPVGSLFLKDYQRDRLTSFINPSHDPAASYNMAQAVITSGSGRILGKGLSRGTQSQLSFLPENHTDFAFSSLLEQFGFMGGAAILSLYGVLMFFLVKKAHLYAYRGEEEWYLFTLGFAAFILFQMMINVGMNMGVMPVAGITLPFISYGGSALATVLIGLAMVI